MKISKKISIIKYLVVRRLILFLVRIKVWFLYSSPKLFKFAAWKILDLKNPYPDRPYGIWCYVGLPGFGKTLSLSEKLFSLKLKYPKSKIYTNFGWLEQDGNFTTWKDLIDIENGSDGVIFAFDEIHTTFNNRNWQSFPIELTTLISQNRKHAKMFVCTAQSFSSLEKNFRKLANFIIECRVVGSRWVFQRAFTAEDYKEISADNFTADRHASWRYSFIATNHLYDSYDTYALVHNLRANLISSKSSPSS